MSLGAELDRLFQQLPSEHVTARAELATRLRKAGDSAGATLVKALRRPTPAAWALNQVHYRSPQLLAAAVAEVERLRELHAQDGVVASQLSAAVVSQQRSVDVVVEHAQQLAAAAGLSVNERRVATTLRAWLAGSSEEAPGRMTLDREESGFDVLSVVGSSPPRAAESPGPSLVPAVAVPVPSAPKPVVGPDPRLVAAARTRLHEREQQAARAAEVLADRRAERQSRSAELDGLRAKLAEAEQTVLVLRGRATQLEAACESSRRATEDAERARARADASLGEAQAELAKLERAGSN